MRRSPKQKDVLECPHGLQFGVDCETDDACDVCDLWEKCVAAQSDD